MYHHHYPWHWRVKEIRQASYQTVPFSCILKKNQKVLHHLSTPRAFETLCLFARLLFRRVAANLAYYPGTTLVSAMSHLCQLHDCHDLGRQEYYMATWKEANTWTQLSTRLSHNTGLFSASIYKPPSSFSYGAHKWLGIVQARCWSTVGNILKNQTAFRFKPVRRPAESNGSCQMMHCDTQQVILFT